MTQEKEEKLARVLVWIAFAMIALTTFGIAKLGGSFLENIHQYGFQGAALCLAVSFIMAWFWSLSKGVIANICAFTALAGSFVALVVALLNGVDAVSPFNMTRIVGSVLLVALIGALGVWFSHLGSKVLKNETERHSETR